MLYRAEKNSLHFEKCYNDVVSIYLQNEIGEIIDTAAEAIADELSNTTTLEGLDRSGISMK